MTDRAEILTTAASLIGGERQQDYGSAADNFARIGNLWAEILGVPVTPVQVALCMNQVKVARLVSSPDHLDSWVDGVGYLAIGGEIATELPDELPEGIVSAMRRWTEAVKPVGPRVVDILREDCRGSDWVSAEGRLYRWFHDIWNAEYSDGWYCAPLNPGYAGNGPFTEVIK